MWILRNGAWQTHPVFELTDNRNVFSRHFAVPTGNKLKLHFLSLVQTCKARSFHSTYVHECVFRIVVLFNKTKTLGWVEPFNSTCRDF